jgi:hypothetical protein
MVKQAGDSDAQKKKKVPLSAAGRDGMTGIRAGYKELQLILV